MSLSDMVDAIRRDNLDELRTLVLTQKCSDTQDLRNTLLHKAVHENKKAITEFLLQVGSNPNSRVHPSKFHIAAGNGNLGVIDVLLNHGPDINEGRNPLHYAARNGNLEIIEILLNHGADINAKDAFWTSPLMYAIKNEKDDAAQLLLERGSRLFSDLEGRSPLHVSVTRGSLKITKLLLQNGAAVNAVLTDVYCDVYCGVEKGYTPLHCVCSSSRVDIVDFIELLLSNGADVDLKTEYGLTPLHLASQKGTVQVINLLLNHNSDINVRANNGYTPLYLAINHGNEDAALMLVHRGAKLNDEFSNGKTILSLALEQRLSSTVEEIFTRCPDPKGEIEKCKQIFETLPPEMIKFLLKYCFDIEFLHIAVKSNQIESVNVLIAHGANVNVKDENGMTPLLYAVVDNNVYRTRFHGANVKLKIAKMLLAAGADVNAASTTEKLTPLHLAFKRSKPKLVKVFLDHNADVNLRDKNGKTALHFAARKRNNSTKLLLENKANVNSKDNYGFTALHIAIDSKNCDVVELLFKFGADINIKNRKNHTPMDMLKQRNYRLMNQLYYLTLNHALALEAINLYYAKDLRSSLSKLNSTDQKKMESHFENCKKEIEKLKLVKVPGYRLTCYALMTRSIHSVASYVKNEDLVTHFQSDDFTTEFPIYSPIIQGRLRNAFQRRLFIGEAGDFFNYNFKLPHECVDHILSCLSSDDLKNVKDAM